MNSLIALVFFLVFYFIFLLFYDCFIKQSQRDSGEVCVGNGFKFRLGLHK